MSSSEYLRLFTGIQKAPVTHELWVIRTQLFKSDVYALIKTYENQIHASYSLFKIYYLSRSEWLSSSSLQWDKEVNHYYYFDGAFSSLSKLCAEILICNRLMCPRMQACTHGQHHSIIISLFSLWMKSQLYHYAAKQCQDLSTSATS